MSRFEYAVRRRGKDYNVFGGAWKTMDAAQHWIDTKSGDPLSHMIVKRPVGEWEVVG